MSEHTPRPSTGHDGYTPACPVAQYERPIVPPVDFMALAARAVKGRLFQVDQAAVAANQASGEQFKLPERLLEQPAYGNGPNTIQRRESDVPVSVMNLFRKNTAAANRLVLPPDEVSRFFHQQFTGPEPLNIPALYSAVQDFRPRPIGTWNDLSAELSFNTEDERRKTYNRRLFTLQETYNGARMLAERPQLALTVLAYQSTILQFLSEAGTAFSRLAVNSTNGITSRDLAEYEAYTKLWDSENFANELIPAVGVFLHKQSAVQGHETITPELFTQATHFLVENGMFRNWVTVPAHVAVDGEERINKFLCPAVGTINAQLQDGTLLHTIYRVVDGQLQAGDPTANQLADMVCHRATQSISGAMQHAEAEAWCEYEERMPVLSIEADDKPLHVAAALAITKSLNRDKPVSFTLDGEPYQFSREIAASVYGESEPQPDDHVLEVRVGDNLYQVVGDGMVLAVEERRPVRFDFNDRLYRIEPAAVLHAIAAACQP